MKKTTRLLGLALAGVGALLLPLNADAACGVGMTFGSYYSNIVGTSNTTSLRSNFWVLNNGNPTLGAGHDNGGIAETDSWVFPYNGNFNIFGDWATKPYDGCPDLTGAPSTQHMVFSFSDVDGTGHPTYAVACVHRDPSAGFQFSLDLPPGSPGPITLVLAPKATITNTVRTGQEAAITVGSPSFAAGFYTDGSPACTQSAAIPQYDVYKQQIARSTSPANTRDAGGPWVLVGTGNIGSPFTFTTNCTTAAPLGNCDVYLAVAPHFNSNFTTNDAATGAAGPARINPASTPTDQLIITQAGPTLAVPPKLKNIKNPGGTKVQP